MGIESTIEYTRKEAKKRLKKRFQNILDDLDSFSNEELEDFLYGVRNSKFDNYMVVDNEEDKPKNNFYNWGE